VRIILFWNSPQKQMILYTVSHGLAVKKKEENLFCCAEFASTAAGVT